ncbi:TonB-dependent receptor, partial [candidate division KSB1 bacterium]
MCRKRLNVLFLFGTLVFGFSSLFAAPEGRIEGHVYDSQSGEPLPGASVFLQGTTYGAATDIKGKFVIPQVPVGNYKLMVKYIGYLEKSIDVSVQEGKTLNQVIRMEFQMIEGEVVTVTAQAEGQLGAINQQFTSNTIANIVSQARIKEMPDVNAAESIGRLPGVAIQRSGGEATKVSIRGLSPKYNTVTVNGVRVPSTGADDRSVDLSLISSNMLDGIEVKKAITPDMDADAIGGTVDLRLKEAPDRWAFNATGQAGYNRLQDYYGNYNFTGGVSNRFMNSKLGVIANFNVDEYDRSADKFSGNYRQSSKIGTQETVIIVSEVLLREETVTRGRVGGSAVLDYRIPDGKITLNGFYNRLKSDGLYRINNMNVNVGRHYYDLERRDGTTSIFTGAFGVNQNFDWFRYDLGVARTTREGDIYKPGVDFVDENTHPSQVQSLIKIDSLTALHNIWVQETEREENVTTAQLNLQAPFRLGSWISGYLKTGGKLRWLSRSNDEFQRGRAGLQYGSGAGNLNDPFE